MSLLIPALALIAAVIVGVVIEFRVSSSVPRPSE